MKRRNRSSDLTGAVCFLMHAKSGIFVTCGATLVADTMEGH